MPVTVFARAPPPLHVGTPLLEGIHVPPAAQRLASRLGITGPAAAACRSRSSAGTAAWSLEEWVSAVNAAVTYRARRSALIEQLSALSITDGSRWYDRMPHMEECASLVRYGGDRDGGKWLCGLAALAPPCIIYSLGSNGDFKFEEAMLESTHCSIFTFDCFVARDRIPFLLHPRIHFESVCVGSDSEDGRFQTLPTIMRRLGHASLSLLKFDIENAEFPVMEGLVATARADFAASYSILPQQLSFEVHLQALSEEPAQRATALVGMFQSLLDIGYVPVSRELNIYCSQCEEFVFIRLAAECWNTSPTAGGPAQ